MFPMISLLSPPKRPGNSQRSHPVTMEIPGQSAVVDQEAATVESTDEASTVPQDVCTAARPHLLTLSYPPDTPAKLTDKFPPAPLFKRAQENFLMGRGQNLDVLLNDEHMPRSFVELSCRLEEDSVPRWYVKNLSKNKAVRLEFNGNRMVIKHNEAKELRDGYKMKLEMLVFVVGIEDGDLGENTELKLEFRSLENGGMNTPGSFYRQSSSSSDSANSSATDHSQLSHLGHRYGGSPVFVQNGMLGQGVPVGGTPHHFGVGHPVGQVPPQGAFVYIPGNQVQGAGMAGQPSGGIVYHLPSGPGLPGGGPFSPPAHQQQHSHHDCCQHVATSHMGCHGGCPMQMNSVTPHSYHHQDTRSRHVSAGSGPYSGGGNPASGAPGPCPRAGNHASVNPGYHPGVVNHASTGPSAYSSGGNHAAAGYGSYHGVANGPSAGLGSYARVGNQTSAAPILHNAELFSFAGGGMDPAVPTGQSQFPPENYGPASQQHRGQPSVCANSTGTGAQAPFLLSRSANRETPRPASGECFSQHQSVSSFQQFSPDDSTHPKQLATRITGSSCHQVDQPVFSNQPVLAHQSNLASQTETSLGSRSVLYEYPTLYTQAPPDSQVQGCGESVSNQRQQNQAPLSHPLRGPSSLLYQSLASPNNYGPRPPHGASDQGVVHAPSIITQPESAYMSPVQQPESARIYSGSGQQPQSPSVYYVSGQQAETALVHNISRQRPESADMHSVTRQAPESSAVVHSPIRPSQVMSPPGYHPSSGELPAAPPVTQLSGLALNAPVQVTSPYYPTEPASATPANSLMHSHHLGSVPEGAGPQFYLPSANGGLGHVPPVNPMQVHQSPRLPQNSSPAEMRLVGASMPLFSLTDAASNGNRINLREHEGIAVPTPPSSDFSSDSSYRVQDLRAAQESRQSAARQPEEVDERQPQEHEDDQQWENQRSV